MESKENGKAVVSVLSESEIEALLLSATHGHLGCHCDGETYVVPISFAYDGKRLLGYTSPGKKIDMMRANPNVCVQVEQIVNLTDWRSAVVWGKFEELHQAQAAVAVGYLIDRYGPMFQDMPNSDRRGREITPPRVDQTSDGRIVYCIHVKQATGRREVPNE